MFASDPTKMARKHTGTRPAESISLTTAQLRERPDLCAVDGVLYNLKGFSVRRAAPRVLRPVALHLALWPSASPCGGPPPPRPGCAQVPAKGLELRKVLELRLHLLCPPVPVLRSTRCACTMCAAPPAARPGRRRQPARPHHRQTTAAPPCAGRAPGRRADSGRRRL